jgi:F0F1-type ATP synthase membrane subunit b/b'
MKNTKALLDLSVLNMATLVRIVNELGGTATMKTFSQRSKAVERVLKLANEKGVNLDEKYDVNGALIEGILLPSAEGLAAQKKAEEEEAAALKKAEDEVARAKALKAAETEKPKKVKGESIRAYAEGLLMEVVSKDGDGRKVGHSYATILDKIKEKYDGAKTSVACLRWYAVHMREAGKMPPTRPRAVPAKAKTTAAEQKPEV